MDDGCFYSTQHETNCRTGEDGATRCQLLKRVFRHCPGRTPEEVSREEENFEQRSDEGHSRGGLLRNPWRIFSGVSGTDEHDERAIAPHQSSRPGIFGSDLFRGGFFGFHEQGDPAAAMLRGMLQQMEEQFRRLDHHMAETPRQSPAHPSPPPRRQHSDVEVRIDEV